jgi:RNAse (barnase) inhibitor barstar
MIKFSEQFNRDYELYSRLKNIFTFSGVDVRKKYHRFEYSDLGVTAKEAFYFLDTNGRYSKCNNLDELYEVLTCKISINLHIKMWAEEYLEYRKSNLPEEIAYSNLFLDDIMTEFQFPVWVEHAIVKQAEKLFSKETK